MLKCKSTIFIIVLLFVSFIHNLQTNKSLNNAHMSSLMTNSMTNFSQKAENSVFKALSSSSKLNNYSKNNSNGKNSLLKKLKLTTNRGFGFDGTCSNSLNNITSSVLPENAAKLYSDVVLPLQSALLSLPQICLGDFSGQQIHSQYQFDIAECTNIPLNQDSKFGVISFAAFNVPCNDLVTVSACLIFDNEGTGAIAFNGDLIGCGVALTGVGRIFQPFIKFIGAMGFGVSLNKKFEKKVDLCYNSNSGVSCGEITTKGHFLFVLNLALPKFAIGKRDLSELLELNATITYMIDFGNISSLANLATGLFNSSSSCSQKSSIVKSIRDLGAEFTMTIEGRLTVKMAKFTNGFLPDLDFNLFQSVLIVTTGGGSSGLRTGFYLRVSSNIIQVIYDIFKSLMDRFLSFFGVSMPTIDLGVLNASLSLFVDTTMFGISIEFTAVKLTCYFNFDQSKGSCSFNMNFFTAIKEAAKWVIKKAAKLFDESGEKIAEFASNTVDFAKDASKAVANFATSQYKIASREVTKVANTVANFGEDSAKQTLNGMISAGNYVNKYANELENQTERLINSAVKDLVGLSGDIANSIKDVYGEAANFATSVAGSIASGVTSAAKDVGNWFKSW